MILPQYEKECCGQHDNDGDHQVKFRFFLFTYIPKIVWEGKM